MSDLKQCSDIEVEYGPELLQENNIPLLPAPGSHERGMAERSLVRKLDRRLLPTIFLIFVLNYIDRSGITTARLKGMQQDLGISDVQYATVIAIFYVSYAPSQIPSNMVLNKISRPSLYIGICTIIWGLISALTGVTKDFTGIILCRVFIGLPEAAFYPGAIYLLSRWYTQKELAFRSAFLYSGLLFSNAFGTLMAAGILSNMEGIQGLRAWQWLFFIAGTVTIFLGLNSMWILPDYPHNTRWLSPFERQLAQVRLSEDAGEVDKDNAEDSQIRGLMMALKDPKVIIFSLMTITQILGLSFSQYFPTLTKTLGFNSTITLLLAAPPWLVAAIMCCLNAWHADKTGERFFHLTGWLWSAIIGFIIALSTMSLPARYISLFFMALGYLSPCLTIVWVANSIPRPPAKRAAAIAIVNGSGNLGAIMGSYSWNSAWGPKYHQSIAICLSSTITSFLLSLLLRHILVCENRKLDADEKATLMGANRTRVEETAKLEGITFEQAMDRRRKYRYLY